MIQIQIISEPLTAIESVDSHTHDGSEIIFHGRVRDNENNNKIIGLDYEYYPGMAEKKLNELAEHTLTKFGISSLICIHRVGLVPVGEISVRIIIWSGHRAEGLKAMDWFIMHLKKDVPIWKWGVTANGKKFPSKIKPDTNKDFE